MRKIIERLVKWLIKIFLPTRKKKEEKQNGEME